MSSPYPRCQEAGHAYEAPAAAASARDEQLALRRSFVTETVFSHPSKPAPIRRARSAGYIVVLHAVLVPEDVTVLRVGYRVLQGGHSVPEGKIRERCHRLWGLIAQARDLADRTTLYDNSRASAPFEPIASYESGRPAGDPAWPAWTPSVLLAGP